MLKTIRTHDTFAKCREFNQMAFRIKIVRCYRDRLLKMWKCEREKWQKRAKNRVSRPADKYLSQRNRLQFGVLLKADRQH